MVFEVCKQVRKISDVPIIMLTAKDFDDDRILGLEMGADDYHRKAIQYPRSCRPR